MKRRKIVFLMVSAALLLSLAFGVSVQAEEVELVWEYEGDYADEIEVVVEATTKAYPGDDITVAIGGEAQEDLYDVTMDIWIKGSAEEGAERWESDEESVLYGDDLEYGDDFYEEYEFEIPETADPGMMLGHITCEWDIWDADLEDYVTHSFDTAFPMTYLMNKDYEDLQEDYANLQKDYAGLKTNYTDLSSKYNSLQTSYNSLKSDYDSLKTTYNSLKSSYDSLKSEHDTLVSDYVDLQKKYTSLDSEHKTLQGDYDTLESEYEATASELSNYTTYTYALAAATIIFVVTTIIFAVRKPKTVLS